MSRTPHQPSSLADDLSESTVVNLRRPGQFGWPAEFHAVVGSTNDRARELALAGAPEGTIVVADFQAAGRGRLGRSWVAPAGTCLMLSMVLRTSLGELTWLTPATAIAVMEAIDSVAGVVSKCKWPNDILLDGGKVAGILIETVFDGEEPRVALLGVGINVNLDPDSLGVTRTPATSLLAATGIRQSRLKLLEALLDRLAAEIDRLRRGVSPMERWRARMAMVGQPIEVAFGGTVERGRAIGVDETGALLLRRDDGSVISVAAGEVTAHRG